MSLIVKKFGGTSVGSIERIDHVAKYLARNHTRQKCICVVSAMAGQTNLLLEQAAQLCPTPPKREVDMLLTAGERVSMALLSIALHAHGVSSISLTGSQCGILTDEVHGNARISRILGDRIRDGLKRCSVVIVAGFQGINPETKDVTTLGRGGTDLTAVAVAHALQADQCDIYTDVDGIFTADPRVVKSARRLERVSSQTVVEMAWAGAKVVHPRAAQLAAKVKLPLVIKNSFNLGDKGTLMDNSPLEGPAVNAITLRSGRTYTEIAIGKDKNLFGQLTRWLWNQGEPADMCSLGISEGQAVIRVVLKADLIKDLTMWLGAKNLVASNQTEVQLITVVGQGFLQSPEVMQEALDLIDQLPLTTDSSNQTIRISLVRPLTDEQFTDFHDQIIANRGTA